MDTNPAKIRPNVIVFFTDQQRWDTTGVHGNPLDLTPMATEAVYDGTIDALAADPEVDALVVGVVPLTAALKSVPGEMEDPSSLLTVLPKKFVACDKPMVVVVDSGPMYEPFCRALRAQGLPVFNSADQAVRSLGRYLNHRAAKRPGVVAETVAAATT
jgi:acyl-CoA synthetase (NDP forming)